MTMMASSKSIASLRSCILTIVLLLSASFQAKAVVLTSGGVLTPGTTALSGGTVLTNETVAFSGISGLGATNFTGSIQLEVVKETGGTLDFYFQVSNNASSLDAIMRLTTGNYTGFATDVDWTTNAAVGVASSIGVRSTSATRTTTDTVGFNFVDGSLGGSGVLLPGTNSALLFIKTDATQFTAGSVSLINDATVNIPAFAPVVPEPGTWVLVAMGTGFAAFLRGRRQIRR